MAKMAKKQVTRKPPVKAKPKAAPAVRPKAKTAARKPAPKPIKKAAATTSKKGTTKGRGGNATESALRPDNQSTVTIKEISNGFLLTESSYKNGKYLEKQTFTPVAPKINVTPIKGKV